MSRAIERIVPASLIIYMRQLMKANAYNEFMLNLTSTRSPAQQYGHELKMVQASLTVPAIHWSVISVTITT